MRTLLTLAALVGLTSPTMAQMPLEDFDGGTWPPAGWVVIDNIGNGQSWDTSSAFSHGNLAGSGECAAIDSDDYGTVPIDGELHTPVFDIPAAGLGLAFDHHLRHLSPEFADVDLSVSGGPWTNLVQYASDITGHVELDLSAYAGATNCQVRFHYYNANYEWYWHVDNVEVIVLPPPPVHIWFEDFDGGPWPPAGWTIVDNIGNGQSWDTSSAFTHGNAAGQGECAAIDSDDYGTVPIDGELITHSFDVPAVGLTLEFDHYFDWLGPEYADVDIRVAGGAWTNLLQYTADTGGHEVIDMDPYVGMDVEIRFHYYNANWEWYWHVDNVGLISGAGSGIPYCFGDPGSGTPCPCGNENDGSVPGSGCANGVFASGARLTGSGLPSISADSLVLSCSGLEPNGICLYFQANNDLSPGNVWGDGLQCAGGQLKRLGVRVSDASGLSDTTGYPLPISVKAGNVLAGDTKYYQCWYANPTGSPCSTDFNASNGYSVTWVP